jgi:predicted ATPase/class 3 adenylate cyclase
LDIAAWLRALGLERYVEAFHANDIDAAMLRTLTADDLKELGVASLGHRRKLLEAIAALDPPSSAATVADAAAPSSNSVARQEAERRQLTVLFCDLVGSTELAAALDPEGMGQVIRTYQERCTGLVRRWEGRVARYLGDGVLAYFGWLRAHEDDAERAVRAGLELVESVARIEKPAGGHLAARVGIATGLVMVGDLIGDGAAQEETVVGETPNLAARLQALAEPGAVVVAAGTRRLVGGLFAFDDLGPQRLKGFAEPLAAFRVEGEGGAEGRFEALRGRRLTPLVGREHELAILLERWSWAKEGDGQVMLLSGEPGIGKSRLVQALRERLTGEPCTPLSHFCSPHHANSTLYPVIGLLERAAGLAPEDKPEQRLAKLATLLARSADRLDEAVALVGALLSIPTEGRYPPLDLSPQRQKQRTLEVLLDQLAGLAAKQPVLAVYEDVHWVDPTTLELLDLMVERIRRRPVLALITFRPEFKPPWAGQAHVTQAPLNRLGRRQGAAIVERLTGGRSLPDEVLGQIVAKTDGVPLFVEELTKTVLESGLLRDEGDRYELAGPLPPLAIPATLHDSLMARLDRLAPIKDVAQTAAVIGREFSHDLLAAVSPLPPPELDTALDQFVGAELIFRRGMPPEAVYSFKHALVQDAAYQSLLKSKRQQLHRAIAQRLQEHFPGVRDAHPEVLAHHYTRAGLAEQAVAYWLIAGKRAGQRSANLEAIAHLTAGLEILTALPETPERARLELPLQMALGAPLIATKGYAAAEVERAYSRARELAGQLGETAQLFRVSRGLCYFHHVGARLRTSHRLGEELLDLAGRSQERTFEIEAHHAAGCNMYHLGHFAAARHHFEQSIALDAGERHGAHIQLYGSDVGVFCRAYLGHSLWQLGFPDRALELAREAQALADRLAHPFSVALAMAYAAMLQQFRRDRAGACAQAEAAIALCTEQRFEYYLAWAMMIRGWSAPDEEPLPARIAAMREGLARLLKTGAQLRRPHYLACLAEMCGQAGMPEQGLAAVAEGLEVAESKSETWCSAELQRLQGNLLLQQDRNNIAPAEASFRAAVEVAERQGAKSLQLRAATSLASLWAEQGKRAQARGLLAPVYGWFTEGFETADLKKAKTLLGALR